jgi:hypothetical protein
MRYGTTTRKTPREVIERASALFGPDGELGLCEVSTRDDSITFGAESGFVSISCEPGPDGTTVTVLSREYDTWAEQFIRRIG